MNMWCVISKVVAKSVRFWVATCISVKSNDFSKVSLFILPLPFTARWNTSVQVRQWLSIMGWLSYTHGTRWHMGWSCDSLFSSKLLWYMHSCDQQSVWSPRPHYRACSSCDQHQPTCAGACSGGTLRQSQTQTRYDLWAKTVLKESIILMINWFHFKAPNPKLFFSFQ